MPYLNGTAISSVAFSADSSWTDVITDFSGVNTVKVIAAGIFELDNTVINVAVPESVSMALLGIGMIGTGIVAAASRYCCHAHR